MNKIGLFKKSLIGIIAFFGLFTLSSCASANKSDARIIYSESTCTIIEQTISGVTNKFVRVTLAIDNQTIFSINKIDVQYNYKLNDSEEVFHTEVYHLGEGQEYAPNTYIRYGLSGYVASDIQLDKQKYPQVEKLKEVSINAENTKVVGFQNLWQTYMGWFIAAIVIFAISFGGYLFAILRKGVTKEWMKRFLQDHIASTLMVLFFALLICIIPLIFSSWMVTIILLGSFVANIILSGLVTLLKIKVLENKSTKVKDIK